MSVLMRWMDSSLYPNHIDWWDYKLFREMILEKLKTNYAILDLGAGRGVREEMNFKGLVNFVAGVDPDPVIYENPFLDEARIMSPPFTEIPYPDDKFNLVFSLNVLEHVQKPAEIFREVHRVLKPGGFFLSKTPNKYHYVPLAARLTPHKFHEYIGNKMGRESRDTFPTVYKCNTSKEVKNYAFSAGFKEIEIQLWEGRPEYLKLFALSYLLGYIYERTVNRFSFLSDFRSIITFSVQKPAKE